MRRTLTTVLAAILFLVALTAGAMALGGGSTITRARLERSLPASFSQLYVQQAAMLGRDGLSPGSLHAKAMCDKHGPDVADVGPGADWVCLMSWDDPQVPMPPEGYGKFEVNVHSNDCYTVNSPTKLTGYLTLTDVKGREVTNPVFEYDGCFDPGSSDRPTGVSFPSLVSVTSTTAATDAQRRPAVQLGCGTGAEGCAGTVVATAGDTRLGSAPYRIQEEATQALHFPTPLPGGATEVTFTVRPTTGAGPSSPSTLPVEGAPAGA